MTFSRVVLSASLLSALAGCPDSNSGPPESDAFALDAARDARATGDVLSATDAPATLDALPSDASLTPNGMLVPACGLAGGAALVLTISDHIAPSTCVADPLFALNTIRIEGGVSGPGSFVSTDASVLGEARLCDASACVTSNNWQLEFVTFDAAGAVGNYRVELPRMAINGTFFVNRCALPEPTCI